VVVVGVLDERDVDRVEAEAPRLSRKDRTTPSYE